MSQRGQAVVRETARKATPGIMDGRRYTESLRDGREIWLHGEKVADVTQHPAFANVVRTFADLYDLQHRAPTQDLMTYVDDDGVRGSISYLPPTSPEELLRRRRNTEVWTEQSFGMLGRLPDFCGAMIVGLYEARARAQRASTLDSATMQRVISNSPARTTSRFPMGCTIRTWTSRCGPSRTLTDACASYASAMTASSCAVHGSSRWVR